jgi:hypothetical protein
LRAFTSWLAGTALSNALGQASWVVPTTQTIHIVAIAVLFSSVLMVTLRIIGWAGQGQSLEATVARFSAWFWAALTILAGTGAILIVTEPSRQLLTISFWLKMSALAAAIAIAVLFRRSLDRKTGDWDAPIAARAKVIGLVTVFVWCLVIFLGRFIAYDEQIWGRFYANP